MKELKRRLPFPNTCISSGDIQVWKMCKVCKWDDRWCHTLNPILHHMYKLSYPGQFAAQDIETWQANCSTGNTATATKILVPWQLTLFQSPPTWFQYVSDFELKKRYMRLQTQANIFICYLLDHVYQAPFANMKIERRGWPEIPLILGRSETQYITMGIKLLNPNCRAHLVEFFCKEWNISHTNWLRYLFSSYLFKTWLSIWRHH